MQFTVERGDNHFHAECRDHVLAGESGRELNGIVSTQTVIPCQRPRTLHERVGNGHSPEVLPLAQEPAVRAVRILRVHFAATNRARERGGYFGSRDE